MLPLIACALAVLTSNQQPESQPLYRFIAYGDGRGHNAGDQDMTIQKEVVAAMLEAKPAFLVQSGDLVYDGSLQSNWDVFDDVMTPVWRAHIPYYPAEGNHDNTGES